MTCHIAPRLHTPSARASLRALTALAMGLVLAACGGSSTPEVPPDIDAPTPRAKALSLARVTAYQAIQIDLMTNRVAIAEPPTPLAAGRATFVRVFVTPEAGFAPRLISARLQLWDGATKVADLDSQAMIAGPSTDEDKASTLNFEVPGAHIRTGIRWRASLHEVSAAATATGSDANSFFPARGQAATIARAVTAQLKVVLVPMRYTADGSNRLPDTSPAAVEKIRALLAATYPAPEVVVTVRAPIDMTFPVTGASSNPGDDTPTGFSSALDLLVNQRMADNAAPDVYYYGLFQPAATFREYCTSRRGCVVGLAFRGGEVTLRGGVGNSFPDRADGENWEFVLAHELGHLHGRGHVPCGFGNATVDRAYPHAGGVIGGWGYDQRTGALYAPTAKTDVMGYCNDQWISDYTYRNILKRMSGVAGAALTVSEPTTYRMLRLRPRGLALGSKLVLRSRPEGSPQRITRTDKRGRALPDLTAQFVPYDHIEGGVLFVPEAALQGAQTLTVGKHALSLTPTR